MPKWIVPVTAIALVLAMIPPALIARARATRSDVPRINLMPDMDKQPRFQAQMANPLFADGRAMRPPIEGTVARGALREDDAYYRGRDGGGDWVNAIPVAVTESLLARGQQRFEIYCSPCHGLSGYGDGPIARRADQLEEGTWTPPTNLHDELAKTRPDGHVYNTITNGIRSMPAYGSQIRTADRWAIVSYVRALQRSQDATLDDVPADLRAGLGKAE